MPVNVIISAIMHLEEPKPASEIVDKLYTSRVYLWGCGFVGAEGF
jgi:hypothetical protein